MKTASRTSRPLIQPSYLALSLSALALSAQASADYGPAIYREAYPGHWYTSGYGKRFYVIHDMEGYYWTTISYFQRSTTQASVHYCVNGRTDNGSDAGPGEITQMVRDAYYAWHAGCWNRYMYGTEHEGFASDPSWYTEAMYQASGANTKFHAEQSGIPKDRNHIIAHGQKLVAGWTSWMQAVGYSYSFATCNTHTDPGPYWDWNHYMDLVNGAPPPPPVTNPPYLFNTDSQGWTAGNGLTSPVNWTDCCGWPGIIYNDQVGNDAFNYGPACSFGGGGDPSLNVSIYPQSGNTANHDMQVFWKTDQDNTWTAGKSSPIVSYSAQNAWTTINLDINANWPSWFNQNINQLRLDYDNNNSGTRWIVNHMLVNTSPRFWFDSSTDGWAAGNSVVAPWETACCGWPGVLVVDQNGGDAYITKGISGFRGAINDRIHVRVYPQGGSGVNHDMQIFFATGDENFYSAAKSTPPAYYAAKDSWIDLWFDVGANPYWSGYTGHDITALRLDFDNVNNGNVRWLIDYVILEHNNNPVANTINNASIVSSSVPSTVNAGAAFTATVTMNNAGSRPWSGNHKLGSQTPDNNTTWGLSRVAVAGTINPGANYTFTINGTAPATVGARSFDWKMVEENVQWFGQLFQSTINVISPGPAAPSSLAASAPAYNQVNLTWVDNSSNETGFKVERSTDNLNFTQVGPTLGANATAYSDTSVSAATLYYYRVKSTNSGGDSTPSNVASLTTPNQPPDLGAIGDKTGTEGTLITFTATSSNPNQSVTTTTWQDFEGFTNNTPSDTVMFRKPLNSSTTSAFVDTTATNFTRVTTSMPAGHSGKVLVASWSFKTGTSNPWIRLTTSNPANVPNPTVDLDQIVRFDICVDKTMNIGLGLRETATAAAYGANGGTTGSIEWDAVTGVTGTTPNPTKSLAANTWTSLSFNVPFEAQYGFTGDGVVASGIKGVLEHLALIPTGGMGVYNVYVDNFAVVAQNTLTYSLDAGFPTGASIHPKTGVFKWTPTGGQAGTYNITVRVTDRLGLQDFETISVKVIATGNHPPVLAAIGNKTVNELAALSFTATATDQDAGQTQTYTLDAGNPTGSSISTGGAFTWTPTEAQGPGSYPITVRVTDNGAPASNDFETITVTVNEVNIAPVLATIADQTINEGATLSATASATDADTPANSITYSLDAGSPVGMTINSGNGAISWVTSESDGPAVYPVTVRATDNGSPALSDAKTFNVTVNEVNIAPVLTVNTTLTTTETVTDFESMTVGTYNGTVLFRQPAFSSSTSAFLDTVAANTTSVATNYPGFDGVNKVLYAAFSFKTGQVNPWLRLTTFNTAVLPNPTIKFTQHVKFRIYSDKSLGVALGLRETSSGADVGQNGGTTGTLEWAGATVTGSSPVPTHTVAANTWTTLDFNLPTETISAFPSSGNGVLDSTTGKGVLEHLALTPVGGSGIYNVYFDDLQVVTVTTNLTVNTGETVTFSASATDADFPAQTLTFSLDTNALPAGAAINAATGAFAWTPTSSQGPSTNVITVRVTDNGPGALSASQNVTIVVNKINVAPVITGVPDQAVEIQGGSTINLTITATDADTNNVLTFSLQGSPPSGSAIGASTGIFTWTPPNTLSTNIITIRVTDNGVPPLYSEKDMTIIVAPTNATPTLTLSAARVVEKMVNFESITDYGNDHVMFRKPLNSSSTSAFIDSVATNYTYVVTSFPAGNANAGAKVLKSGWTFKTGTGQWLRLTTSAAPLIPNPTIDFGGRLKFDIYSDKSIKVAIGVRETATSAAIGANGGTTGGIEWLGATKSGTTPVPSRTVNANTWTTLEFTNASEYCTNFSSGNSVLATGKGVLEHLVIVPNAGSGAYTIHADNFEVVNTPPVSGTIAMNTGSTMTFTASGTDPDPGSGLNFGVDADSVSAGATMDGVTGAFTWTPTVAGTTNITVTVNDNPTNGALIKAASSTFTVVVSADPLGPQSVSAGESATLSWPAVAGASYQVQYKHDANGQWANLGGPITADGAEASVDVSGADQETYYRIVDLSNSDQ